jgi:peptidoglycan/LPS O-acetylase OafA/YrhL
MDHPQTEHVAERDVALDGIRGIAILLAVAYHVWQDVPAVTQLDRIVEATTGFFWIGVDLFFVLSGFLITRILFKTRESPDYFRSFYARRVLRTWPLYFFAIAMVLGVPALVSYRLVEESSLWFVFLCSNYLTAFYDYPRRIVVHFWSLAIEEQFYLVWPLIRYLKDRESIMKLCVGVIVFSFLLRATLLYVLEADSRLIYALTFTRLDSLATGGLLGLWLMVPGDFVRRRMTLLSIACLCVAILAVGLSRGGGTIDRWSKASQTINYTLIAGLFACLIGWSQLTLDEARINRIFRWWLLPIFGRFSYSIYIFHIWFDAIGRGVAVHPATNPRLRLGGTTIPMTVYFTILLAIVGFWAFLTWKYIESPCLSLKQRFGYRSPTV